MANATEQLASSFNFGAFGKAKELKQRLLFTLGALIVYRLGTFVPIPGIDPVVIGDIFAQQSGGILGVFDAFAGGALSRMSIFALNVIPYISAAIIMQLMTAISPRYEAMKKEGESGRKKINQHTRYLTVLLAVIQAYGLSVGLEGLNSSQGPAVGDPGMFFRASTVITIVGGTMFLMWLGEQITARGVGNGISLIIFAGIVANLPTALASTLELGRTGALPVLAIIAFLIMAVAVIAIIVFFERAQRRIIVQYPKRQMGNRMFGGEASHIPLKLNTSGVIPIIFATSILLTPVSIAGFSGGGGNDFLGIVSAYLGRGQPLFLIVFAFLIAFFAFFYTAIVFNPTETAENLKGNGGFVPGIRPGKNTADYFDYVLSRLTVVGAIYLVAVALLPEILISKFSLPFFFGGTSLLIVVVVAMDTVAQIQSYLLAHQYEGLIRKSRLKGRRG
ncbi:MAG: preprotein translocase subunit SecY [Alphaproteobacteria bacterium]|nr:preprotein translocase subunit SecY [Alphaproteobacteria bacterium]|tara:strand:- start:30 stop:1373 length:1344 start_codon:yes stop_codon:yes gene_type:complete